jgi:hypothetical protein
VRAEAARLHGLRARGEMLFVGGAATVPGEEDLFALRD